MFLKKSYYIFLKDVQSEWRSKEIFSSMFIFSLLAVVVISFAFNPTKETVREIFPGVIWVAFTFAGVLGLNRSFVSEKINDCLLGLMLCPVDRAAIYFGKVMANLSFMLVIEFISLPIFLVLFNFSFSSDLFWFVPLLLLASFGFIAIGTFLAALTTNTRSSEVLLPIILFPLLIPIIISAVELSRGVLAGEGLLAAGPWLGIILAYDLLFLAVPILLFEYLLEV